MVPVTYVRKDLVDRLRAELAEVTHQRDTKSDLLDIATKLAEAKP